MKPPPPPAPRHLEAVVDLLCIIEAGGRIDAAAIPAATRRFFLENAERFRPVAWAALGLLTRIARTARNDDEQVRVAAALPPLAMELPARAGPLLTKLAEHPSPKVRAEARATLGSVLRGALQPDAIVKGWAEGKVAAEPDEPAAQGSDGTR